MKLDKWDSQILFLSKGHFYECKKELEITTIDMLKAIWADRCGLDMKYVRLGSILSHLVTILSDLNLLNEKEVCNMLGEAIDCHNSIWPKYSDNDVPMVDALIVSTLGIMSYIQVKDHMDVDGEEVWVDLIEMHDKYYSFLDVFEKEIIDG